MILCCSGSCNLTAKAKRLYMEFRPPENRETESYHYQRCACFSNAIKLISKVRSSGRTSQVIENVNVGIAFFILFFGAIVLERRVRRHASKRVDFFRATNVSARLHNKKCKRFKTSWVISREEMRTESRESWVQIYIETSVKVQNKNGYCSARLWIL